MARRRKKEGFADDLVMFPWWISITFGCVAFAVLRWIVPSKFAGDPALANFAALSRSLAWLPLLVFGFVGLLALARSRFAAGGDLNTRGGRGSRKSWRDTSVNMSRLRFKHGWGVTRLGGTTIAKPKDLSKIVFDSWSLAALRALEWKRFELLCANYYDLTGLNSETIRCGPEGDIDMKLFKTDPTQPVAILHCKTWNVYTVGVKEVRELLAMMSQQKVSRGIFITTGTFNRDALSFVDDHGIQLLDGDGFLRKIQALPKEQQDELFKYAFEGDYRTPTCPSCNVKMTKRQGERGPFWGCMNYPRCNRTLTVKG